MVMKVHVSWAFVDCIQSIKSKLLHKHQLHCLSWKAQAFSLSCLNGRQTSSRVTLKAGTGNDNRTNLNEPSSPSKNIGHQLEESKIFGCLVLLIAANYYVPHVFVFMVICALLIAGHQRSSLHWI